MSWFQDEGQGTGTQRTSSINAAQDEHIQEDIAQYFEEDYQASRPRPYSSKLDVNAEPKGWIYNRHECGQRPQMTEGYGPIGGLCALEIVDIAEQFLIQRLLDEQKSKVIIK